MPHQCSDSFVWWRIVMSALGPPSTTRFVLSAHLKFMDRDGSNCRPSVRRLAIDTDLNKDTVAVHRKRAIESGWLIVGGSARAGFHEFYPALPDSIVVKYPELLSKQGGRVLSDLARQSMHATADQQSEATGMPVRDASLASTGSSDISPLSPLTSGYLRADEYSQPKSRAGSSIHEVQERLRSWLGSSPNAQKYRADHDALARLTPPDCRFAGYEDVICRWCAERSKHR